MDLRELRAFVAVARREHFTRAAAELRVAQPALSQTIAKLERDLGVRLFARTSRSVRLTDAGRLFLERAERLLADAALMESEMHRFTAEVRGRIDVGALQLTSELALPPILRRFHAEYPLVEVGLREDVTDTLLAMLQERTIDLAIVNLDEPRAPHGVTVEMLYTDEIALVVAPSHRFARRSSISLRDLGDEPFIAFRPGSGLSRMVGEAQRDLAWTPHVAFESGDSLTVRALAAEGLGVALLPRAIERIPGPAVAVVPLVRPRLTRTISLAHLTAQAPTPAAAAFANVVRETLGA